MSGIRFLIAVLVLAGLSFAISQDACGLISSPGTYTITTNLVGAPTPVGIGPSSACIVIDSSNVVLDCAGHSITNPTAPGISSFPSIYGIFINQNSSSAKTNVTVKNCPNIQNYTIHVYGQNVSNSFFYNDTIFGTYPNYGLRCDTDCSNDLIQNDTVNGGYGGILVLFGGANNLLDNNDVINQTVIGIEVQSLNTNVTNSRAIDGGTFFTFWADSGTTNLRFENNNASNVGIGFYFLADNSIIRNNRVTDDSGFGGEGYDIQGSNNLVTINLARNNSGTGFSISGSTNNLTFNNATVNGGDGFFVDGLSNHLTSNFASGNSGNGVLISHSDFTVADSNNATNNSNDGFLIDDSSGGGGGGSFSNLTNNLATGNLNNGYELILTDNNILDHNNATSNSNDGFLINDAPPVIIGCGIDCLVESFNNLTNNLASNNGVNGFELDSTDNNLLMSNNGSNNGGDGLNLQDSPNNTVDPSFFCNNVNNGITLNNSNYTVIQDSVACNNGNDGIRLVNSSFNNLSGDNATGNPSDGFLLLSNSNNNILANDVGNGNGAEGISFTSSDFNSVTGSVANGNSVGFYIFTASSENVTNSSASGNADGFEVDYSDNSILDNNNATGNFFSGFRSDFSTLNVFSNDMATGNSGSDPSFGGFYIFDTNSTNLTSDISHDNFGNGITLPGSSDTLITDQLFYNNALDFNKTDSGMTFNITDSIFDNPSGGLQDFTNLSVDAVNGATINWSAQPAPLPSGYVSFAQKFVNITNMTAGPIDKIVWQWSDSELSGYNENRFELWKYNGAWIQLNTTPDTVANQLSLTNISSFSVFAILQNNQTTNLTAIKLNQTTALPSPGGLVQFNITVTNSGDLNINPVKVVDVMPAGLTLLAASPVPDTVVGQTLTWNNVGPLASNFSQVFYVNATVDEGLVSSSTPTVVLSNVVNATGSDIYGDNVTSNSMANVTVFYTNVSIVKVDITPVLTSPGGTVQWQINVSNPGQVTLDPAVVTDVLPAGFQYVAASPAADNVNGQTITWNNVGPITAGSSTTILVNSTVNGSVANGTYVNNVNVTASPPNGDNVSASDSAQIGIFAPAINVIKTVNGSSGQIGQKILYKINVTNTGSINLTITVVDNMPLFMNFSGASIAPTTVSGNGLSSGENITWANFTVLAPGSSAVILYNATALTAISYTNNVTATGVPPNGNSVNDTSSATKSFNGVPPGGNGGPSSQLSASLNSNCSGNVVTVTSGGVIQGAQVIINGNSVGSTDQNGQVTFQGCGNNLILRASKSGYQDGVSYPAEISCGQCQAVKCTQDSDCATDQKCQVNENASLNQCVPVQCGCGQTAQNHVCNGQTFQCGTGPSCSACPSGQVCGDDHTCKPTGCTSSLQCKDNEVCLTSSGAPGTSNTPGSCKPLTGDCGVATNHTFVPYGYQCGTEPGCPSCPSAQSCVDHQCVQNDINCPSTVVVGDDINCKLTQNNQACGPNDNCSTTVTGPDGSQHNVPPDDAGNVLLGATITGKYKFDLLKNGQLVKEVFVDVVPKSAPSTNPPPTAAGPDIFSLVWLLLLLLIIIGAVIYWRSRGQKNK